MTIGATPGGLPLLEPASWPSEITAGTIFIRRSTTLRNALRSKAASPPSTYGQMRTLRSGKQKATFNVVQPEWHLVSSHIRTASPIGIWSTSISRIVRSNIDCAPRFEREGNTYPRIRLAGISHASFAVSIGDLQMSCARFSAGRSETSRFVAAFGP